MYSSFPSRALYPLLAGAAAAWLGGNAVAGQLQDLVREALEKNPGLQASRLEAAAAREDAGGAGAWDSPQIGVEFHDVPFTGPGFRPMQTEYFLQQAFPFPGKRAALVRAEGFRARSASERAGAAEDALIGEVKSAYFEIYGLDARGRINGENQALVRRLIDIARKQYEVGLGRQSDILRAQAELSALASEAIAVEEDRQAAVTALNALLDRPADRPFDSVEAFSPMAVPWSYAQLVPLAETHNPELRALQAERAMRGAERAAIRREYIPDLMVKGSYLAAGPDAASPHGVPLEDAWSLMAAVDLPFALWSGPKYRAGYRGARVREDKAAREERAMANATAASLREALLRAQAAWARLELARGTLAPQADQSLQAALAAYQTGKGEFMALLDAYRVALMARQAQSEAATRLMMARAALERALGMDLDEAERALGGKR